MRFTPRTSRRSVRRLGAAVAGVALGLSLAAPSAAAAPDQPWVAPVGGSHVSPFGGFDVGERVRNSASVGFQDIFGTGSSDAATSRYVWIEAGEVRTYCVEVGVIPIGATADNAYGDLEVSEPGALRDADAGPTGLGLGVAGLPQATWLAQNSLGGDDAEAAATQLAIWYVVNGRDIDAEYAAGTPDAARDAIFDRAHQLIAEVSGADGVLGTADDLTVDPAPYVSYSLDLADVTADAATDPAVAAALGDRSTDEFRVLQVFLGGLTTAGGTIDDAEGIAGETVTLSVPADSGVDLDVAADGVQSTVTVTTGSDGYAHVVVGRPATEQGATPASFTVTAATTGLQLPAGALLTPEKNPAVGEQQQLITAAAAALERTATATVAAQEAPLPAPDTTTETPEPRPTQLPFTGGVVTLPMLVAAAGAGAAGLALLLRRPRS